MCAAGNCGSGPNVAVLPAGYVARGIATPSQAFQLLNDACNVKLDPRDTAAIQVRLIFATHAHHSGKSWWHPCWLSRRRFMTQEWYHRVTARSDAVHSCLACSFGWSLRLQGVAPGMASQPAPERKRNQCALHAAAAAGECACNERRCGRCIQQVCGRCRTGAPSWNLQALLEHVTCCAHNGRCCRCDGSSAAGS